MPENIAKKESRCPTCGGEMIQKSRARLIVVGLGMIASVAIAFAIPLFWVPGILLALTGIYLSAWGAHPPRVQPTTPRRRHVARTFTRIARLTPKVRRQGAPNYSRGGCAPISVELNAN